MSLLPNQTELIKEFRDKFDSHLAGKNIPWEIRQQMEDFAPFKLSQALQHQEKEIRKEIEKRFEVQVINLYADNDDQNYSNGEASGMIKAKNEILNLPSLNHYNQEK